jgi:hypothetical protein
VNTRLLAEETDATENSGPDPTLFDLCSLVAAITAVNRHDEVETGPAVGEKFG